MIFQNDEDVQDPNDDYLLGNAKIKNSNETSLIQESEKGRAIFFKLSISIFQQYQVVTRVADKISHVFHTSFSDNISTGIFR